MEHAEWMEWAALFLEWVGVAIITCGSVLAIGLFVLGFSRGDRARAYDDLRANLGRAILLGLEFLVGADIVSTVTSPLTWETVGLLALIVLIRTFLSFSLETEIEGVAPWRRRGTSAEARGSKESW